MKKYIQPSLATESVNAVILAASGPTANDAGNPGIGNGGQMEVTSEAQALT